MNQTNWEKELELLVDLYRTGEGNFESIKSSILRLIEECEPEEKEFVGEKNKYGKLLAIGRKLGIQKYKDNLLKRIKL